MHVYVGFMQKEKFVHAIYVFKHKLLRNNCYKNLSKEKLKYTKKDIYYHNEDHCFLLKDSLKHFF